MLLLIILVAIVIQRFLGFNSYSRQVDWAMPYYLWMKRRVNQTQEGHAVMAAAILVLPLVLVMSLLFGFIKMTLGPIGYAMISVALLWYCLDARDLRKEPYENPSMSTILVQRYQHCFAILFWYALLGVAGITLYFSITQLKKILRGEAGNTVALKAFLETVQNTLDWVPVRLLGLTFALVGHFGHVFKQWLQKCLQGINHPQGLLIEWGQAALNSESGTDPLKPATDLMDRSLLVWLVVLLLIILV